MKETDFIKRNKKKWHEFEKLSGSKSENPDKLSELFVELTEDLSYAKTFYPKRSVRVYLNYLSQKVFLSFNRKNTKKPEDIVPFSKGYKTLAIILLVLGVVFGILVSSFQTTILNKVVVLIVASFFGSIFAGIVYIDRMRNFFLYKVPLEVYRSRKQLFTAFLFFVGAVLVGVVSSSIDPEFSRIILGNGYVDMTEKFIDEGDPMAVYKQMEESSMFLQITINNIRVAFIAFIMGVFFSVGTVFVLLRNGFMVGAFQHFFYAKGLFLTSFLTIWIHGAIEISVIIIAGGAGIVMGNGILFPGTLTRVQSFQIHAKRGIHVLLGTVPMFIIAGFLEGYVTRHTEMPMIIKALIIFTSFVFIVGYFVVYPWYLNRKLSLNNVVEEKPVHIKSKPIKKDEIRDLGGVFYDSFRFYTKYMKRIGTVVIAIVTPLIFVYLFFLYAQSEYSNYLLTETEILGITFGSSFHFNWVSVVANVLFLSINIATVIHCVKNLDNPFNGGYLRIWRRDIWPFFFKSIPFSALIYTILLYSPFWLSFLALFMTPFIILIFYPAISGELPFLKGISKGASYGGKDWGNTFLVFLMMATLAYFFTWAYHNPILQELDFKSFILDDLIKWHTITVFDNFLTIKNFISSLFILLIVQVLVPLLIIAFCFQYFSVNDKENALSLRKRFENFGKGNKHFEKI